MFVWGVKILIVTDHHSLCWLMKKRDLAGRLARWSLQLQDLDITIVHRSGRLHSDADALSRHPTGPSEEEDEFPMLFANLHSQTNPDIRSAQESTAWCQTIMSGLRELNPSHKTRKLVQRFHCKDGVLYRRFIDRGQAFDRLCLPPSFIESILLSCHDDITAGHLGITRTIDKIRKRFFWPKMIPQIIHYIRSCLDCQSKKKPLVRPAGLMKSIVSRQSFERV